MSTNAFSQLFGGKQAVGFHHRLPGMHPPGLNRVEPGTFSGQKEGQDAHPFARFLDLAVVLTNPGFNVLAVMPGGVIERLSRKPVLPPACSLVQIHSRN